MKNSPLITRDAIDYARSQARWIVFLDNECQANSFYLLLFCYFDINLFYAVLSKSSMICNLNGMFENIDFVMMDGVMQN